VSGVGTAESDCSRPGVPPFTDDTRRLRPQHLPSGWSGRRTGSR
jgi:hypothetical protein